MTREELIDNTDKCIQELVIPKVRVQKAYNYVNCIIDTEQFRYLEENFGIGNPTAVEFIPLIKKHVDALVGEHLEVPLLPSISCKDKRTIGMAMRGKQLKIKFETKQYLKSLMRKVILLGIDGSFTDQMVASQIQELTDNINRSYVSEYEMAASDVVGWLIQNRSIDIYNRRRQLITDMLVSGQCYYRAKKTPDGHNVMLETYNPMNAFPDKNPDSNYVRDCSRIVIRHWMTRQDVLNKYGKWMNADSVKELNDIWRDGNLYNNSYIIRTRVPDGQPFPYSQHIGDDISVTPGLPEEGNHRLNYFIPVYEVEWIETEKEGSQYVKNRYRTVRIGESIYITFGKDNDAVRSIDDPTNVHLSVNGLFFTNRNNKPFSLVLKCGPLQDKYNIVHYLRDNVLANSGTIGQYVDISKLPAVLGDDWSERLERQTAYRKQGMFLFDSSQDGTPMVNTSFVGFDDTLKAQTIQSFELILQSIERTCSSITGVFPQRLDGIQQYDAVRNVQAGARNSYIVTKWIYQQMDSLDRDILMDALDIGKQAYKDGLQGEIILGKERRTFVALPEHFTMSDFDIHLPSSTKLLQDAEVLKGVIGEFVKSGQYEPDIIMEAITAESITELKQSINEAYKRKEQKENLIGNLQQQIEQLSKQNKEYESELSKMKSKIEALNEEKLKIEREKMEAQIRLDMFKAKSDNDYKKEANRIKNKQLEVEMQQVLDGNPYNDAIKNV